MTHGHLDSLLNSSTILFCRLSRCLTVCQDGRLVLKFAPRPSSERRGSDSAPLWRVVFLLMACFLLSGFERTVLYRISLWRVVFLPMACFLLSGFERTVSYPTSKSDLCNSGVGASCGSVPFSVGTERSMGAKRRGFLLTRLPFWTIQQAVNRLEVFGEGLGEHHTARGSLLGGRVDCGPG